MRVNHRRCDRFSRALAPDPPCPADRQRSPAMSLPEAEQRRAPAYLARAPASHLTKETLAHHRHRLARLRFPARSL